MGQILESRKMNISISFLYEYDQLLDALVVGLGIKKSAIKKSPLSRKTLSIKVMSKSCFEIPVDIINRNMINGDYEGEEIKILHHDENFIVLNKPPFVHCHPLKYSESNNCLSFLRSKGFQKYLEINDDDYDRGLLNRLDFETSGVLIYVLNQELYEKLRKDFNKLVKVKTYLAIVHGNYKLKDTQIHFLRPSLEKGKKMKEAPSEIKGSLRCNLQAQNILYLQEKDVSLVQIQLFTGVRHQIRAQLSLLGHPIVGDILYGGQKDSRIYLHAYEYQMEIVNRSYSFKSMNAYLFNNFFDPNCCFKMFCQ